MSRTKVMRVVPIFVGLLLCIALMQTAFAAWYLPNLNTAAGDQIVWDSPNLNAATGNPMVWDSPNLNAATENPMEQGTTTKKTKTLTTMSGSVPPSDLMNIFIPLQIS